ncbi:IucA/IucC family C-terminal-domain containing protein [Pseudoneobacillus sp. C159]
MVKASSVDITTLSWFRLGESVNTDPLTIELDRLLSGEMESYLQKVMVGIGAPNEKVAASIFMKRYAFFAVMALFTMSHSDRKINIQTSNVTLVSHFEDGHWLPRFFLKDLNLYESNEVREKWREGYIKDLFVTHLYPLMDQLSKVTNVSKLILWENIAVYLFWLYETVLVDSSDEQKQKMEEDFRYLFYEAPGSLFGDYHQNPLTQFDGEKIFYPAAGKEIRTRKTCCFNYKLVGNQKRCNTCPCYRLDEEGRCQNEQSFCTTIRSVNE